jgi:hypothetical protein
VRGEGHVDELQTTVAADEVMLVLRPDQHDVVGAGGTLSPPTMWLPSPNVTSSSS